MKLRIFLAALAATTASLPADAALLTYRIFGGSGPSDSDFYRFTFQLDTERAPSFFTSDTLRYAPTAVSYSLPGSTEVISGTNSNLGPSFFAAIQQGGISILRLPQGNDLQPRFFGPALFEGTTAAPIFLTGDYELSTQPKNLPTDVQIFDYTVRITTAVPEPGTWALMIAGFGLVGLTMRRRTIVTA